MTSDSGPAGPWQDPGPGAAAPEAAAAAAEGIAATAPSMASPSWTSRASAWLLVLAAAGLCCYLVLWILRTLGQDYPYEYREGAIVLTTDIMRDGMNPYALEVQPVFINVYGIAYHWVMLPVSWMLGSSFFSHRLVSLLALLAFAWLLFRGLRWEGVSRPWAGLGALLVATFLATDLFLCARPDALGILLFLGALVIPWRTDFSTWGLVWGGVLSILGFLTKPYFIVALPLVALYLFLFRHKGKGLWYGLSGAVLLLPVILLIHWAYPCYFTNTFFIHWNYQGSDWGYLRAGLAQYWSLSFGLILIPLLSWDSAFRTATPAGRSGVLETGTNGGASPRSAWDPRRLLSHIWGRWERGLLATHLRFPVFLLWAGVALVVLRLGRHPGNLLLYHHTFITPFLVWVALHQVEVVLHRRWAAQLLLLANIALLFHHLPALPQDHTPAWRELDRVVRSHRNVFNNPPLAKLVRDLGRPVWDNGQTYYFPWGYPRNFTQNAQPYLDRGLAFRDRLYGMVRRREFDLIVISREIKPLFPREVLTPHYRRSGILPTPMTYFSEYCELYEPLPPDPGR